MAWLRVLPLTEVPVGQARTVRANGFDLLVCRLADDRVCALEDVCSHDDAPLGDQALVDGAVSCPRHGARFDATTGAVLRSPAPVGVEAFPARIVMDWVEIDLED